jgi:hypothetical protein
MATKTNSKPVPSKNVTPAAPVAKAAPAPAAPVAKAAPAAKATASYKPTQEEIAARAFEIYQRDGGTDQENWLRAERELIARGRR